MTIHDLHREMLADLKRRAAKPPQPPQLLVSADYTAPRLYPAAKHVHVLAGTIVDDGGRKAIVLDPAL